MAIAVNNEVIRQNRGFEKAGMVVDANGRKYVLSMHTGNGTCSFTELAICEKKFEKTDLWYKLRAEASNGEVYMLSATKGTQILTTLGWVAIEEIDHTTVILDYVGRRCKGEVRKENMPSHDDLPGVVMVTAFNRNVVVDGLIVREPSIASDAPAIQEVEKLANE